jgi:hypothetical protein
VLAKCSLRGLFRSLESAAEIRATRPAIEMKKVEYGERERLAYSGLSGTIGSRNKIPRFSERQSDDFISMLPG